MSLFKTFFSSKLTGGSALYFQAVFTKSRQHVCHVRRKIQMSDVGFVKIIIIWCLGLPIGRHRVKSFQEDCQVVHPSRQTITQLTKQRTDFPSVRLSVPTGFQQLVSWHFLEKALEELT